MPATSRASSKASRERVAALTAGYRTLPGVRDEFLDETGLPRPHWLPMLNGLAGMGPAEVERSFAIADRHQRDSGVYYRVYDAGESKESSWPLSHVPLVIPHDDWATISAGLVQRAELLDRVLSDVYGPADLVRDGALPAAVVAGEPGLPAADGRPRDTGREASAGLRGRSRARA